MLESDVGGPIQLFPGSVLLPQMHLSGKERKGTAFNVPSASS